jgi:hypothetical protein
MFLPCFALNYYDTVWCSDVCLVVLLTYVLCWRSSLIVILYDDEGSFTFEFYYNIGLSGFI